MSEKPRGRVGHPPKIRTRQAGRLQAALDRHGRTRRWAAGRLGITEATLSRNLSREHPTRRSLLRLAALLTELEGRKVDVDELRGAP